MRVLAALCLLIMLPVSAVAGPWPREAQGWFVSTSYGRERDAAGDWHATGDVYAEYGAHERLTIAAQLRRSPAGWRGDLGLRWHPAPRRLAVPFGLGAGLRHQPGGRERFLLMLGAHVGHGFDTALGSAWARLDLQMQLPPDRLVRPAEMSLTAQLGLEAGGGLMGMIGLTAKRRGTTTRFEVAPAIGHALGRRHTLVLGATATPSNRRIGNVQLSVWSRF
ncbi:MAG: hypothetical protein HLUCCA12_12705 [Rhodobacteraceae bacterium HLUCCA12]|nr:MAG: hypothetical protein HLUCCA12_12705 [Rhodobacteraceae bacterium HLUCCA12]